MIILGISAFHGDCSASLLKDGKLIAAVEEERFTRIKHWAGFPKESIRYCLAEAGIQIDEVDRIAVSKDPHSNMFNKVKYVLKTPASWGIVGSRLKSKKVFESFENLFEKEFETDPSIVRGKIVNVEHHLAHLASTFFVSPFKSASIISIDGFGDFVSAMYGTGTENSMKSFEKVFYPHSIGIFYTMMTQFLGFKNYGDEYKVMGLSSFGKPEYQNEMENIISYSGKGKFKLNMSCFVHNRKNVDFNWETGIPDIPDLFSKKVIEMFGKPRDKSDSVSENHRNLAASMQKHTESIIFKILNYVYKETKEKNLCYAGGVAMNSVVNGKILKDTPFENIYIPPVAGDAGTSMGAAFYVWNQVHKESRNFILRNSYLGPGFTRKEINTSIDDFKGRFKEEKIDIAETKSQKELLEKVVSLIIGGNVIGWFQGRMEFGARALGNRSIVVDPRSDDMQEILNARIKKREKFRPFAPSILEDKVKDWFEEDYPVPFMEKVYKIKEGKKGLIPAVTHVDGTGRLQSVNRKDNPLYYDLISKFGDKTGVPILLNTSFNENEPIVCTPKEAIEAFLRTKMDVIVLGNLIIKRT